MKKNLGETHFATEEKRKEKVLSYLRSATGEFYDSSTKKIVHGIDLNDDYVEKHEKGEAFQRCTI